jgi:hypothetical protein
LLRCTAITGDEFDEITCSSPEFAGETVRTPPHAPVPPPSQPEVWETQQPRRDLPALYVAEEPFLASPKAIVREFPSIRHDFPKSLQIQIKNHGAKVYIKFGLRENVGKSLHEKISMEAYVSVELANEAGEVVVLEVLRKQIASELSGAPDDEGRSVVVPGNEVVDGGVVDHLVSLD